MLRLNGSQAVLFHLSVRDEKLSCLQGKIYAGGFQEGVTDADIRDLMSQYGSVIDIQRPVDRTKNEPKSFCFVTFEKEEVANDLIKKGTLNIKGKVRRRNDVSSFSTVSLQSLFHARTRTLTLNESTQSPTTLVLPEATRPGAEDMIPAGLFPGGDTTCREVS